MSRGARQQYQWFMELAAHGVSGKVGLGSAWEAACGNQRRVRAMAASLDACHPIRRAESVLRAAEPRSELRLKLGVGPAPLAGTKFSKSRLENRAHVFEIRSGARLSARRRKGHGARIVPAAARERAASPSRAPAACRRRRTPSLWDGAGSRRRSASQRLVGFALQSSTPVR